MPAVIVIDLQTGMMDGVAFPPLFDHERILANANRMTAWARGRGAPVAFVRHDGEAGDALERGAPGWPIHPAIVQTEGEPIFEKTVGDAFAETNLAGWLRERNIDEVILLGAATDQCVTATCKGALANGFSVIVAGDAHSTMDWNGETAAQIIDRHNRMFAELGARVETVEALAGG
jgi:nicotinamidase-related amidase